jgi:hypothetical protein
MADMWWANRKAMYGKYYYMFESYSPNTLAYRNYRNNDYNRRVM